MSEVNQIRVHHTTEDGLITTFKSHLNPNFPSSSSSIYRQNELIRNQRLLPRSQRVWELDRHASECRRCFRRFTFLFRRHHCR